jgi:hypothetical protein
VILRALIDGRAAAVRFERNEANFARASKALRDRCQVAVGGILQRDPKANRFGLLKPQ